MLWRRLDVPGHEYCRLDGYGLRGIALFAWQSQACRLEYEIVCDAGWSTTEGCVRGAVGDREIDVVVRVVQGRWQLNGEPVPAVDGCVDVDLNFSPSTNLLPIRRLQLSVGDEATVRAAWLRFPSFTLEPLEQTYRRSGERGYRYSSAGGRFVAEIDVDESGLPVRYGDIWCVES